MRRDRIYLSGPVTSIGEAEACKNFQKAEDELRYLNYITVNPMKMRLCVWIARHFGKKGYMLCLLIELCYMALRCDTIYMLADWQLSPGARAEKALADALGMPVIFQLSKEEYKRRMKEMTL